MDYETVKSGDEGVKTPDTGEVSRGGENDTQTSTETPEVRGAREQKEAEERERRAKKRRLIPPFVMLFAGAVISITMRILHYEMKTMLIILLCVLVGFYIAGSVIKYMLDRFEKQLLDASMEEGEVIEKELAEEDGIRRDSEAMEKDE